MEATVVLYFLEIPYNVSPFATVCVGVGTGVGVGAGFGAGAGAGAGAANVIPRMASAISLAILFLFA